MLFHIQLLKGNIRIHLESCLNPPGETVAVFFLAPFLVSTISHRKYLVLQPLNAPACPPVGQWVCLPLGVEQIAADTGEDSLSVRDGERTPFTSPVEPRFSEGGSGHRVNFYREQCSAITADSRLCPATPTFRGGENNQAGASLCCYISLRPHSSSNEQGEVVAWRLVSGGSLRGAEGDGTHTRERVHQRGFYLLYVEELTSLFSHVGLTNS